jgi:hypothetical protein
MKKRMSAAARCKQLLKIMRALFKKAKTRAEFKAEMIAKKAKVSTVLVYRSIGPEFRELRLKLPGSDRGISKTNSQLRRENAELRRKNKELSKRLREAQMKEKQVASNDLSEAISFIEQQDEIIRIINGELKMLRQRLAESEMVVMPPSLLETEYKIKRPGVTTRITS